MKKLISFLVAVMVVSVSLSVSISSFDSEGTEIFQDEEQTIINNIVTETKSSSENNPLNGSMIFKNDDGWWMFSVIGEANAKLQGCWISNASISTFTVPKVVCENVDTSSWAGSDSKYVIIPEGGSISGCLQSLDEKTPEGNYIVSEISNAAFSNSSKAFLNIFNMTRPHWNDGLDIDAIYIPNTVKTIGARAFENAGDGVNSIEFEENSQLESILTGAFAGTGIKNMYSVPGWNSDDEPSVNQVTEYTAISDDYQNYQKSPPESLAVVLKAGAEITLSVPVEGVEGYDTDGICYETAQDYVEVEAEPVNGVCTFTIGSLEEGELYVFVGAETLLFQVQAESGSGIDDSKYLKVTIPKSVGSIGDKAFGRVQKLTFEEGSVLNHIGSYAFSMLNPAFETVIPASVKSFGTGPFNSDANITFEDGSDYRYLDGNLIKGTELVGYYGTATTYTFPDYIDSVADYAFVGNKTITTITIPSNISWGMFPFKDTNISKVIFDDDLTVIPDYLLGMTSIKDLIIPARISVIGEKALYKISTLETVSFENGTKITEIEKYAFLFNEKLTTVTFGSSAEGSSCTIDDGAFFYCNALTQVNIDSGFRLIYIGNAAFAKWDPNNAYYGAGKGYSAVSFGMINGIQIPAEVTFVGQHAFACLWYGLTAYSTVEPGANTLTSTIHAGTPLKSEGFIITFEEGSKISMIDVGAFANLSGISCIDLSNCKELTETGVSAFDLSNPSSDFSVLLPTDGKLQYLRGFTALGESCGCAGSVTIPASVQTVAGATMFSEISFAEGSELTWFGWGASSISFDSVADLSNCHLLESIEMSGNLTLPAGVYSMNKTGVSYTISNASEVIYSGDLSITQSTIAINKDLLGTNAFSVEDTNGTFYIESGCLVYNNGSEHILLVANPGVTSVTIASDSGITSIDDNAFRNSDVRSLYVYKDHAKIGNTVFADLKTTDAIDSVDVYLLGALDTNDISSVSLRGDYDDISFYISPENVELSNILRSVGSVSVGHAAGTGYVFLPERMNSFDITYSNASLTDGTLSVDVDIEGGYTLRDVEFSLLSDGSVLRYSNNRLDTNMGSDNAELIIISVSLLSRVSSPSVNIIFDANGGNIGSHSTKYVSIPVGMTVIDSETPSARYANHDFGGWYLDRLCTEPFDADAAITSETIVYAKWIERAPHLIADTDAGDIILNGSILKNVPIGSEDIVLSLNPYDGYETHYWVINDIVQSTPSSESLRLSGLTTDTVVSVTYTYYSSSSGLVSESNRGLPTSAELLSAVYSWTAGGDVDMSGMAWDGHSSVPLIVDNYVYIRAGAGLYKIESDTGYVVKSVDSKSTTAFYHQIGYGNGMIVDYLTGSVYDLDLNKLFSINESVTGVEYYDGYFYTSGNVLYRFAAVDTDTTTSGESISLEKVGVFAKSVYSSYGFSSSVFVDGFVYRVYADGNDRGIVGMDISGENSGTSDFVKLSGLSSMYLDDGWISYYNGVLYLSGYTQGLFGAVATTGSDTLAYVSANGLSFGIPSYYVFDGLIGFVSEFVVSNGYGFVNAGGQLFVFSMNADGTIGSEPLANAGFTGSHGSITVESSYANEENGMLTYIYMIPYQSDKDTMVIMEGYNSDAGYVLTRTTTEHMLKNYNSQAVRAGLDGQMIWYNDSGQIYSYATPDANRYLFFIQDGSEAQWYESYGATSADALAALGSETVTLGAMKDVSSVNGKAGIWNVFALEGNPINKVAYSWSMLYNLNDRSYDTCHYYAITAGSAPVSSTEWKYADGNMTKTYAFADNIGDREIIGKELVLTDSLSTIRFFDGSAEVEGSMLSGSAGSAVDGSFPVLSKSGQKVSWQLSTDSTVSALPGTFAAGEIRYNAVWSAFAGYSVSYDAAGGSGVPADVTIDADSRYVIPDTVPVRNGYLFVGYSLTSGGDVAFAYYGGQFYEPSFPISGDVTLYAVWAKNTYSVDAGIVRADGMYRITADAERLSGSTNIDDAYFLLVLKYDDRMVWTFTQVVWDADGSGDFRSSVSTGGLEEASVTLVSGDSVSDYVAFGEDFCEIPE